MVRTMLMAFLAVPSASQNEHDTLLQSRHNSQSQDRMMSKSMVESESGGLDDWHGHRFDPTDSGDIDSVSSGKSASNNSGELDAVNLEGISRSPTCQSYSCRGDNVKRQGFGDFVRVWDLFGEPDEQKCCLPKQTYKYLQESVKNAKRTDDYAFTESIAVRQCNGWAWCKGITHEWHGHRFPGAIYNFLEHGEDTYYTDGDNWVKRKVTTCESFWPSECPDNSDCIGTGGVCVARKCRDTIQDYWDSLTSGELCSWAEDDPQGMCAYRMYEEYYEIYDSQDFNTGDLCCSCGGGEMEANSCDDVVCRGGRTPLETPPPPPYYMETCCTFKSCDDVVCPRGRRPVEPPPPYDMQTCCTWAWVSPPPPPPPPPPQEQSTTTTWA